MEEGENKRYLARTFYVVIGLLMISTIYFVSISGESNIIPHITIIIILGITIITLGLIKYINQLTDISLGFTIIIIASVFYMVLDGMDGSPLPIFVETFLIPSIAIPLILLFIGVLVERHRRKAN